MENLKEKTARGLMWGAVNNSTMQVLNLLIGILVLRHLTPEDTGLIGMLAIFSAIAGNLQSSGFSTALINEKAPTKEQYNSVFWFNILMGGVLYLILFFSAPLIAWFFHQPRLTDLSRFLFLAFFISSFGISTNAYMVKNMMNREITIVNLSALLISGTSAIIMVWCDMAYWTLAWQQVINAAVLVIGRFLYVKWKPTWHFSFDYIRQTFSFSMGILSRCPRGGKFLSGLQMGLDGFSDRRRYGGTSGAARLGECARGAQPRAAGIPKDDALHGLPLLPCPLWTGIGVARVHPLHHWREMD